MPYGTDVGIPNGAGPSQLAPQGPTPQAPPPSPPPAPPQGGQQSGPYNLDALADQFGKIPSAVPPGPPQFANQGPQTPATGSLGQIAQAGLGRNVNERLQIWSKMVGDQNAVIGPNSDVWIRGDDSKFHPADSDKTSMLQDIAKFSGGGVDMVTQGVNELAQMAIGAKVGGSTGAKVGAILGWMTGPGASSYIRQQIISKAYGVSPQPGQLQRDFLVGGAVNTVMGGALSTLLGPVARNAADAVINSAENRSIQVARSQQDVNQFMNTVGAKEVKLGDAPLSDAGQQAFDFLDGKRTKLNQAISDANSKILAANPTGKPNVAPAMANLKELLLDNGKKFDDHGMPIPFDQVPIYANEVPGVDGRSYSTFQTKPAEYSTQVGSVNEGRIRAPRLSSTLDDLSEDYKAMASGQMDMSQFLEMGRKWQDNANFKDFTNSLSNASQKLWSDAQHSYVTTRQAEISSRISDPAQKASIDAAYHDYSSSKNAMDMFMNAFEQRKGSPESFAKFIIGNGNEPSNLRMFKDMCTQSGRPDVFDKIKGAWTSEALDKHISSDGVIDAPGFFNRIKGLGNETMNTMYTPEELGQVKLAASRMNSIKTNDLFSQPKGDSLASSVSDLAKQGVAFDMSKPSTWTRFFQNKTDYAHYLGNGGLDKLAARSLPEDATKINNVGRALNNWVVENDMAKKGVLIPATFQALSKTNIAQKVHNQILPSFAGPQITPPAQGATGLQTGMDNVSK